MNLSTNFAGDIPMRHPTVSLSAVVFCLVLLWGSASAASRNNHSATDRQSAGKPTPTFQSHDMHKPYNELIKDRVKVEGLFTFYQDTVDNTVLMSIKPEQFGPVYLCGESRTQAEGAFFDSRSMGRTYPFYFRQVGNEVMLIEKNLRVRADSTNPMFEAVKAGISDHLIVSTSIKSQPQDSTKAILVDASDLFVRDAAHSGYRLSSVAKTGYRFDAKNSYFLQIKSFPENSEISVRLHFESSKPAQATTLQNPYSFFHTYHYSLSEIPETDYVPRYADDRVGHFLTLYEDNNRLDRETPYVRYIQRWNLKKKDPDARISEPVKPIVYWIENTVPEEYRDAVAEGIEFWNPCFEKVGIRRAIVAKQMPDTATWDPADVRYSTVQWMVQPGGTYAVGPHRSNPYTGEILDADIRISVDFIRFMFTYVEMWVSPVAYDGSLPEGSELFEPELPPQLLDFGQGHPYACNYAAETARDAAVGLQMALSSVGDLADKDSITKEFVYSYIVDLVAHEVGHTLGLRHNFKSSSIYTLEQISDREFTRKHGLIGSVMDYSPPNISPKGYPQGEFYASTPGPYDYWAIEYAYSDFGAKSPDEETEQLEKIASKCADPLLVYATDEDAFGRSLKSLDPLVNLHDRGAEPLRFARLQVDLVKKLWYDAIGEFETDGERYQKIYSVFQRGWRWYFAAAQIAPKYVGGLYHHRHHIGDPNAKLPFVPVPAEKQQEAVAFLSKYVFAPDAFALPADLLNKLQEETLPDFSYSVFTRPQIDFPLHASVLAVQNLALRNLYSPYVLGRLVNNLERYPQGEAVYTMYDLFHDVRGAVWTELQTGEPVNSFRRQLQLAHLDRMIYIYLGTTAAYPSDALTLAANDLDIIQTAAQRLSESSGLDGMTRAHYREVLRQIDAAKNAERNYSTGQIRVGMPSN
jgi:hypothetical protein